MKVIFIGLHHKPDMEALDSRTRSGKVIDLIINYLPRNYEVEKKNLFSIDYHPTKVEAIKLASKFEIDESDIHVLLGKQVQYYLQNTPNSITVCHPGYALRKGMVDSYVAMTSMKVISKHCFLKPETHKMTVFYRSIKT